MLAAHVGRPILQVDHETVRYNRRVGNSLDRQRDKFRLTTVSSVKERSEE
jgi:hypothetical protein